MPKPITPVWENEHGRVRRLLAHRGDVPSTPRDGSAGVCLGRWGRGVIILSGGGVGFPMLSIKGLFAYHRNGSIFKKYNKRCVYITIIL